VKLGLTVNGASQTIEILAPAPACRFRIGDGPEQLADIAVPAPGNYSILLGGRSYDVLVERAPRHLIVTLEGHRFEIEVLDPRHWSRSAAGHRGESIESVIAPMPGKVVRVLAAVGDAVTAGQGLMVVEAMKMQNEMKVSRPGRVLSLTAKVGATVAAGEVLATIGSG
jgi:biotin carboxyl carrier protein